MRASAALLATACAILAGCGYTVGFQPRTLASGEPIRSVAVPIFENRSLYRELEFALTEAVVREIQRRTPLIVTSPERADVTIRGEIERFGQGVLVEGPNDEVVESSITVALGLRGVDREGRLLFAHAGPRERPGVNGPALVVTYQFAPVAGESTLERPTAEAFRELAERVVFLLEQDLPATAKQ